MQVHAASVSLDLVRGNMALSSGFQLASLTQLPVAGACYPQYTLWRFPEGSTYQPRLTAISSVRVVWP